MNKEAAGKFDPSKQTEEIPQDTRDYLKSMYDLLRAHNSILSSSGLSMGRSEMSIANYFAFDLIELMTDTTEWNKDTGVKSIDRIQTAEYGRRMGIPTTPKSPIPEDITEMAIRVRTVFYWAERQVDKKERTGSEIPYWGSPISSPVKIIASMLDELVDPEEARAAWIRIRDDRDLISDFTTRLRWDFQDKLNDKGKTSIS